MPGDEWRRGCSRHSSPIRFSPPTPVIMISAATELENGGCDASSWGAEDYLPKPFKPGAAARPASAPCSKREAPCATEGRPGSSSAWSASWTRRGGSSFGMVPDEFFHRSTRTTRVRRAWRDVSRPPRKWAATWYDCFEAAPGVAVPRHPANVSGKGMAGSFVHGGARPRSLLRASTLQHGRRQTGAPARALRGRHGAQRGAVARTTASGMFVTLFLGFLDIATGPPRLRQRRPTHRPFRPSAKPSPKSQAKPGPPLGVDARPPLQPTTRRCFGPQEALVHDHRRPAGKMTDAERRISTTDKRVAADLETLRTAMPRNQSPRHWPPTHWAFAAKHPTPPTTSPCPGSSAAVWRK